MVDSEFAARLDVRRHECGAGLVALRLSNRRIAASSVAPIRPGMNAPCVLALLGSKAAQDDT